MYDNAEKENDKNYDSTIIARGQYYNDYCSPALPTSPLLTAHIASFYPTTYNFLPISAGRCMVTSAIGTATSFTPQPLLDSTSGSSPLFSSAPNNFFNFALVSSHADFPAPMKPFSVGSKKYDGSTPNSANLWQSMTRSPSATPIFVPEFAEEENTP